MSGDAKRRFCEHCQLHVHNLSAMSRRERDFFVTESAGRSCIAYQLRLDGTMVTPSFWRGVLQPFRHVQFAVVAVLATLLPFFFAGCASTRRTTLGIPMTPEVSHTQETQMTATANKSLQPTPGSASCSAARLTSLDPAWLSSGR
jgi:hypothetical protein